MLAEEEAERKRNCVEWNRDQRAQDARQPATWLKRRGRAAQQSLFDQVSPIPARRRNRLECLRFGAPHKLAARFHLSAKKILILANPEFRAKWSWIITDHRSLQQHVAGSCFLPFDRSPSRVDPSVIELALEHPIRRGNVKMALYRSEGT